MLAPVALASSFDDRLARAYEGVLGRGGRARGMDVLLTPMVNTIRVPFAGRNVETCREEPPVSSRMVTLNTSSGRSGASADKFPSEVLTGRYAAGFSNTLMAKDVRLYLDEVRRLRGPWTMGAVTDSVWEAFSAEEPGADFTRVYPFVAGD